MTDNHNNKFDPMGKFGDENHKAFIRDHTNPAFPKTDRKERDRDHDAWMAENYPDGYEPPPLVSHGDIVPFFAEIERGLVESVEASKGRSKTMACSSPAQAVLAVLCRELLARHQDKISAHDMAAGMISAAESLSRDYNGPNHLNFLLEARACLKTRLSVKINEDIKEED